MQMARAERHGLHILPCLMGIPLPTPAKVMYYKNKLWGKDDPL